MTNAEAAALLGVPENVSLGELRRRYETLHTDYQIRLTNAPTPALKKTYQQKLQELVAAGDVLHPGFSTTATGGDLPSSEPTLDDFSAAPSGRTASRHNTSRASARGDLFTTGAHTAAADASSTGLPRSTLIAIVFAVVLAAALSFVLLRWSQTSARLAVLQEEGDKLLQASKTLQARVDANERFLYSDRLRVRNLSEKAVRITAAAFVYRDSSGTLKLAHSGNFDYPTWEIRPNGVAQLDAEMARGRAWDGPVLYYAFLVEYPNVEPFLKAGIWAEDIDRLDKVVTLDLD